MSVSLDCHDKFEAKFRLAASSRNAKDLRRGLLGPTVHYSLHERAASSISFLKLNLSQSLTSIKLQFLREPWTTMHCGKPTHQASKYNDTNVGDYGISTKNMMMIHNVTGNWELLVRNWIWTAVVMRHCVSQLCRVHYEIDLKAAQVNTLERLEVQKPTSHYGEHCAIYGSRIDCLTSRAMCDRIFRFQRTGKGRFWQGCLYRVRA